MRVSAGMIGLALLAGCGGATRSPPPGLTFDGVPVAGTLADARGAGFTRCYEDTTYMRCRRDGIMLAGEGPYNGAVDLNGNDGAGGFDHLVIWSDESQSALLDVGHALRRDAWQFCFNGRDAVGREVLYWKPGEPVLIAIDLSYWGKRRARVFPAGAANAPRCADGGASAAAS